MYNILLSPPQQKSCLNLQQKGFHTLSQFPVVVPACQQVTGYFDVPWLIQVELYLPSHLLCIKTALREEFQIQRISSCHLCPCHIYTDCSLNCANSKCTSPNSYPKEINTTLTSSAPFYRREAKDIEERQLLVTLLKRE